MASSRTAGIVAIAAGIAGGAFALWYFLTKKGVISPPGAPPRPSTPPRVEVSVTGPDTAEATVSWDPVQGATYYKVYKNGSEVLGNVQGTTTKLTDLVPGQTYYIAIAACK